MTKKLDEYGIPRELLGGGIVLIPESARESIEVDGGYWHVAVRAVGTITEEAAANFTARQAVANLKSSIDGFEELEYSPLRADEWRVATGEILHLRPWYDDHIEQVEFNIEGSFAKPGTRDRYEIDGLTAQLFQIRLRVRVVTPIDRLVEFIASFEGAGPSNEDLWRAGHGFQVLVVAIENGRVKAASVEGETVYVT